MRCSRRETSASKLCVFASPLAWEVGMSLVKLASSRMGSRAPRRPRAGGAHIAAKAEGFKAHANRLGEAKKKRIGREGARRSASLRGKTPIQRATRGLGGKKHRAKRRTEPSRLDVLLPLRCGARLTINRLN